MVEKRRKIRREHLKRFRETGRVVSLTSDAISAAGDSLHSDSEADMAVDGRRSWYKRLKPGLDRILLAIEILAVAGLFFIIYHGILILRDLNTQFSESLTPSTLTPTPLIVAVVLPSGHTPPNSVNGAQPNES